MLGAHLETDLEPCKASGPRSAKPGKARAYYQNPAYPQIKEGRLTIKDGSTQMPPAENAARARVRTLTVDERGAGQRIDNFVLRECPKVPKTRIYRAFRKGEIRLNKGRVKPDRRLQEGDLVRLPPLTIAVGAPKGVAPKGWQDRLRDAIVHEDENLLAINKPSGLAVHGGSGLQFGLIETLRLMLPEERNLELVHRLDRETSGLILIAKRTRALKALHELLRRPGSIDKRYLALVSGRWPRHLVDVQAPLLRYERRSGERMVRVAKEGKASHTEFRVRDTFADCSLVEAKPLTGRTHQIRVHAAYTGHPLLGDAKYSGDHESELAARLGLKRLFLHAESLKFRLFDQGYSLQAPIDRELMSIIDKVGK